MVTTLLLVLLIGLIPANIAYKKGYNFFTYWFCGSMLFIIALPWTILMKPNQEGLEKRQIKRGMKKCFYCAEMIKKEAKVCRFCNREID